MLLGDRRVKVDHNLGAPSGYIPMVNPKLWLNRLLIALEMKSMADAPTSQVGDGVWSNVELHIGNRTRRSAG